MCIFHWRKLPLMHFFIIGSADFPVCDRFTLRQTARWFLQNSKTWIIEIAVTSVNIVHVKMVIKSSGKLGYWSLKGQQTSDSLVDHCHGKAEGIMDTICQPEDHSINIHYWITQQCLCQYSQMWGTNPETYDTKTRGNIQIGNIYTL